jgi:hypothetical protein
MDKPKCVSSPPSLPRRRADVVFRSAPVLFIKPPTALADPLAPIPVPKHAQPADTHQPDFEVELVAVLGRPARDVPEDAVLDYVLGYTGGNDVSFRFHQMAVSQATFSKGFGACRASARGAPGAEGEAGRRLDADRAVHCRRARAARPADARARDRAQRGDDASRAHQVPSPLPQPSLRILIGCAPGTSCSASRRRSRSSARARR